MSETFWGIAIIVLGTVGFSTYVAVLICKKDPQADNTSPDFEYIHTITCFTNNCINKTEFGCNIKHVEIIEGRCASLMVKQKA